MVLEPDTLSITKADTTVGGEKVKTVTLGIAAVQTGKKDKPHQCVCLSGDEGKVLLTFFTEQRRRQAAARSRFSLTAPAQEA